MTWPCGVKPLDLADFESRARNLRYRALGAACRDKQIKYLLLGHHEDDQAETVLMRMASGHKGTGLQGMLGISEIPECWGVHGVHESGYYESASIRLGRLEKKQQDLSTERARDLRRILASEPIIEKGGVSIVRPLLRFNKSRLYETCRAQNVTWEEDETNKNVWRTPRNAIRKLLSGSILPAALQKESMISLAYRKREEMHKTTAIAAKMFSHCEIWLFDVRSGGLIIRLPNSLMNRKKFGGRSPQLRAYIANVRMSSTVMLRRIVEMVTPQEEVALRTLRFAVLSMFPELRGDEFDGDPRFQEAGFTACGVQFQRLRSPLPQQLRSDIIQDNGEDLGSDWHDLDPDFVWKLTRQPFSTILPTLTVASSTRSTISPLPLSGVSRPDTHIISTVYNWSPWKLWDGRYWIRVLNFSIRPLIVRPFQIADLQALKATLPSRQWRMFHDHLGRAAPEQLRWTLLTIAEVGHNNDPGRVLALPTLGQTGQLHVEDENGKRRLAWNIRYKKIHLDWKDDRSVGRNRDVITTWND